MSATGRGAERHALDYYPTPAWCVHRLLERVTLPGGAWLEPCAGDGAIIRAVNAVRSDVRWTAIDIRPECSYPLRKLVGGANAAAPCDFLGASADGVAFNAVITNPPFSHAQLFIDQALLCAPIVVMLLRLNFLGAAKRTSWFRSHMPDVYVLPNRPSFTGAGTDSTEYAWMVWDSRRSGSRRIEILDVTPRSVRCP